MDKGGYPKFRTSLSGSDASRVRIKTRQNAHEKQ